MIIPHWFLVFTIIFIILCDEFSAVNSLEIRSNWFRTFLILRLPFKIARRFRVNVRGQRWISLAVGRRSHKSILMQLKFGSPVIHGPFEQMIFHHVLKIVVFDLRNYRKNHLRVRIFNFLFIILVLLFFLLIWLLQVFILIASLPLTVMLASFVTLVQHITVLILLIVVLHHLVHFIVVNKLIFIIFVVIVNVLVWYWWVHIESNSLRFTVYLILSAIIQFVPFVCNCIADLTVVGFLARKANDVWEIWGLSYSQRLVHRWRHTQIITVAWALPFQRPHLLNKTSGPATAALVSCWLPTGKIIARPVVAISIIWPINTSGQTWTAGSWRSVSEWVESPFVDHFVDIWVVAQWTEACWWVVVVVHQ